MEPIFDWRGITIYAVEEWTQCFEACNWYTFHLVHVMFENDVSMGTIEANFILFGVGFSIQWHHTTTELVVEIQRRVDEIKAHRPLDAASSPSRPHPTGDTK